MCLALLVGIVAAPALAGDTAPLTVTASPVALNPDDPNQTTIGALEYRGGIALSSEDPRFGGLSGLDVSADGARIVAISDRGFWFTARLEYDADGRLIGLSEPKITPLRGLDGHRLGFPWTDAEDIARLDDGEYAVSFERHHRIWIYPPGAPRRRHSARNGPKVPSAMASLPPNGGIETLTELADGTLLALSERGATFRGLRGWLFGKTGKMGRVAYQPAEDFAPTSAFTLANGDVLVLERRFKVFKGRGTRLTLLSKASITPGALLRGREIAFMESPLTIDNFEGLAARRNKASETLLLIVSDDDFSSFQRSLLMQFRLKR